MAQACPDCGAICPDSPIEKHRYFGASSGCWKLYTDILAREYNDIGFMAHHRYTVDAYALQHPSNKGPQTTQSVHIHLFALTLIYDFNFSQKMATKTMQRLSSLGKKDPSLFQWLTPPNNLGTMTVLDVHPLNEVQAHLKAVKDWAFEVWTAWKPHHSVAHKHISNLGLS